MPTPARQTERRRGRIRRIANEAVHRARGLDGWRAYEAAKHYVRREYSPHVPGYTAIIDRIKKQLEI